MLKTRQFTKSHLWQRPLGVVGILICLVFSLTVNAQYRLDTWTTDAGLPQNSVTGLAQTLDGYLWLTTNDGLVRFDGLRFKVFNKSGTPELTTNRLVGAFGDQQGRLWFQTEDGGVVFYENGAFNVALKPHEIPTDVRSPFFDDPAGGVIFYSNYQHYRYQAGKFVPFKIAGLPEDCVIILTDREGGLWFTNRAGIYRVKDGAVKAYDLTKLSGGNIYKIAYEDRQGRIWLGYSGEINNSNETPLLRIKGDEIQSYPFAAALIRHFAEDQAGNLWMTVYNQGIFLLSRSAIAPAEPIGDAVKQVAMVDGISPNSSGFLCPDREGGMWVGTEKGLVRILTQAIRVFSKKDGLPEENVYPIYQDRADSIWAGIWQNSLVKYDAGTFKTFLKTPETFYITSLFEDRSGRFWVGNLGMLRYLDQGKLVNFTRQAGFQGIAEFSVIAQDQAGNLWFGTDHGLSRYADGQATVLTKKDGLPDDYITAFLQAKNGTVWVGTRGGIAALENGTIQALTAADGLASDYTRSLYEDADGTLWIGSYDGGLTRLKDGKLTAFTMHDGLSSNGVFCILEDARGWFWINSNQGIYRISKQELNDFADGKIKFLNSIAYNKQDGLLNSEGNGGRQPAGIKARDGKLWFPTAQGIAVVDPEAIVTNPLPPPVLIEEISINRKPVDNKIFQAAVRDAQTAITLAPGDNNLEIGYTGLSFINSEQVKFRYKLAGLDADWNEVGARRTAYYSYLPPGEYTFQVIAANRDGVWNTAGASVRIKVLPPFYRTWGFILLCLLGLLAVIFFGYRYRVGALKKKAAQQENFARQLINSQEVERGRIAAELHDGLSQSLVIIKTRAMLSLTDLQDHDRAFEQLREIADASTFAIDEVKDIIYDLRPIQLDRLGLTGAIEEIAEKVAEVNNLALTKNIDNIDKLFPKEYENSLYRILQESLNNIIKHSAATAFEIGVRRSAGQIELTIRDNGRGFDRETVANNAPTQKGGFGLIGMIERAKLLGGQAVIETTANGGTRVSVVLPLGEG